MATASTLPTVPRHLQYFQPRYKGTVKHHRRVVPDPAYGDLIERYRDTLGRGFMPVPGGEDKDTPKGYLPELYIPQTLPIEGQGTYSVLYNAKGPFRLIISKDMVQSYGTEPEFVLDITEHGATFRSANNTEDSSIIKPSLDKGGSVTKAEIGQEETYWFSLDQENKILRYGKGYSTTSLTLLQADLSENKKWKPWMKESRYLAISDINLHETDVDDIKVDIWPMPVNELSPVLVSCDKITLEQLEDGSVTVVENLDPACQQLYANVAGGSIKLDSDDFPEFSKAIQYSIATEGCMANKRLKEKAGEFGKEDINATYLRITLGMNKGDSPGSPFVVEIWPAGHFSPVHNHSNSFAVIKVLHGKIESHYYASLDPKQPASNYYKMMEFHKDEVTWISNRQLQTHQLKNTSDDVCVTIQCYQYGQSDAIHYEFFDYVDVSEKKIKKFKPDSDWQFIDFKKKIKAEWEARKLC